MGTFLSFWTLGEIQNNGREDPSGIQNHGREDLGVYKTTAGRPSFLAQQ